MTASVLPLCAVLRRHAVPKRDRLQPYSCPLASRKAPLSQPGGRSRDVTRDYGAVIKSATNYHHTACESPQRSCPSPPRLTWGCVTFTRTCVTGMCRNESSRPHKTKIVIQKVVLSISSLI